MKPHSTKDPEAGAFTLIEMIGVLAVIAILVALLIPKVFSTINDARINSTILGIQTIKSASADHYGKYGNIASLFGTNNLAIPIQDYCTNVLLPETLIEKTFSSKLGTNAVINVVAGNPTVGGSGGYTLDGSGANTTSNATAVIQAVIYGVAAQDAKDLNDRLDGPALGTPLGATDAQGRVQYASPFPTTVYVYISSR
jgi:type II secretory pathway pseudopilin PulG